jgi:peptidoglycan L-alanyl-D-glutamate endopeptidase CwlK
MSSRKIEDLSPEMQPLVNEWVRQMNELGISFIITCTLRTKQEQIELYAQGRTTPGPIVTWTLNSLHLVGKAFDFCIMVNGKCDWKMKSKDLWDKAIAIGKSLGLSQVIGRNGKVKESAHLQLS